MHAHYDDIFALAKALKREPLWFDENGVPRFCEHAPQHAPDIYAKEVVLLRIACQACHWECDVQLTASTMDEIDFIFRSAGKEVPEAELDSRHQIVMFGLLKHAIKNKTIHYGDPPTHNSPHDNEYCHAGCTMNVYDLRVLEYWLRDAADWKRDANFEVEIEPLPEGMEL